MWKIITVLLLFCGVYPGLASADNSIVTTKLDEVKHNLSLVQMLRDKAHASPEKSRWLSAVARHSACVTLWAAEVIASEDAEKTLMNFRTGEHSGLPQVFEYDSLAMKELMNASYYQQLVDYLVRALADWYQGKIPYSGAVFSQAYPFRVFGGSDFISGIVDGIDMSDIIGSITYYAHLTTEQGVIHIKLTNVMSLESYAGANYFKHRFIDNPKRGAFSSTHQILLWQLPIPEEYR